MAKSFAQNLRYFRANFFCELLRMKRNEFCAVLRNLRKTGNIFAKVANETKFGFAQNRKFYAKCNFLGKLSKIDILSLEYNN